MRGLIYLNLNAEAYYSGAEYSETVFITPQDYLNYFTKNVGTEIELTEANKVYADDVVEFTDEDVKKAYMLAKQTWHDKSVSVGELDGKHSEVDGNVYVDFFDEESIKNQYNKPANDGDYLFMELLCTNGFNDFKEQEKIIKEIEANVAKMVEEIGVFVDVRYRIPKDKVEELNLYVKHMLEREQMAKEYAEDLKEFTELKNKDRDPNATLRKLRAEQYESFMNEFSKFRENKRGKVE